MAQVLAERRVALSRWVANASYTKKWLALGAVVGLIAGLGAVVFYSALQVATHFFLLTLGGYQPPSPVSEGAGAGSPGFVRPWAIPVIATLGALLGSLLVFGVAPDAEGHGTDAAIAAVHHNPRGIRLRTVFVKIVASALTIGSGGSGGREGPTGQISAGFGSWLARTLDLSPADARIAVAAGVGSGIGAIFGAPLAGSVLATEIMYRDDFEVEALLPSFIASAVGYTIWGSVEGYRPLFGYVGNYALRNPDQLGWFAVLGVLAGLTGLLYAGTFYAVADWFSASRIPRWLRPALGGAAVGLMGLAVPEVLSTGYGWIQRAFGPGLLSIPLWIVLTLPLLRIVATSLSIGTGGSGGIFGPGMVIGAFLGASVWRVVYPWHHAIGSSPGPFVIVGMMACFGSISRAPLAVMLMVSEMTGSISLVVPAMVALGIATLIVRRRDMTIYRSQLRSRSDSPAHQVLTGLPLLRTVRAGEAATPTRCIIHLKEASAVALARMERTGVHAAPVIDDDERFVGIVTRATLVDAANEPIDGALVDISDSPVHASRQLDVVLDAIGASRLSWAVIIDDERRVVGIIGVADLVRIYRNALSARLRATVPVSATAGLTELVIEEGSPLDGMTLQSGVLPHGVLVVTIQRSGATIEPEGHTMLSTGDQVTALGGHESLERLRELARSQQV